MRLFRLTLRARMALITAAACALVALLLAAGLSAVAQRLVQERQLARLSGAAALLQDRIENGLQFGRLDLDAATQNSAGASDVDPDIQLRVSLGGAVLGRSRQFPADLPLNVAPGVYRLGNRYVLARELNVPLDTGLETGLGSGTALLTLALSARSSDDARSAFLRAVALILPLSLLLAALASWWAAGRMLRPVSQLERAARQIGESGDLTRPLLTGSTADQGRGDELARLAATLQHTFAQLAQTREREQQFLRAASHDLRSPLTALTARVSQALSRERDLPRLRADLREIGHDLDRLGHLTEHLLLLARDPHTLRTIPVDLRTLLAGAVDAARLANPDADIDLAETQRMDSTATRPDTSPGAPLTVQGDAVLLGQALANLIGNALVHAPGAAVTLGVRQDGGSVVLSVQDDGPGVDAVTLPRLGEAFYRPGAARSPVSGQDDGRNGGPPGGHGLGLAIVRHAAALHGGALMLSSAPGQGFRAELRLPARGGAVKPA